MKDKMGRTCNIYVGDEKLIQNCSWTTWRK